MRLAPPLAHPVAGEVDRDLDEPGPEERLTPETPDPAPRADEGLLRELLRRVRVADETEQHRVHLVLVAGYERGERLGLARLDLTDYRFVLVDHSPAGLPDRSGPVDETERIGTGYTFSEVLLHGFDRRADLARNAGGTISAPVPCRRALLTFPKKPRHLRDEPLGLVEERDMVAAVEDDEFFFPAPFVETALQAEVRDLRRRFARR